MHLRRTDTLQIPTGAGWQEGCHNHASVRDGKRLTLLDLAQNLGTVVAQLAMADRLHVASVALGPRAQDPEHHALTVPTRKNAGARSTAGNVVDGETTANSLARRCGIRSLRHIAVPLPLDVDAGCG